jgi:hypothetical protein
LIALFFFNHFDLGKLLLVTTALLLQKLFVGPDNEIPKHLSLIIPTSSDPYVLNSQAVFCLLSTTTGALLSKINMPVCDPHVSLLPMWSASKNN